MEPRPTNNTEREIETQRERETKRPNATERDQGTQRERNNTERIKKHTERESEN
jgi:hypothetical protein